MKHPAYIKIPTIANFQIELVVSYMYHIISSTTILTNTGWFRPMNNARLLRSTPSFPSLNPSNYS